MMRRYRITLTNGSKWVTPAPDAAAAKTAAFSQCPELRLFGVHILKIEELRDA